MYLHIPLSNRFVAAKTVWDVLKDGAVLSSTWFTWLLTNDCDWILPG